MNLPKISLDSIPGMDAVAGVFGSISGPGSDDRIVIIMVYVYEQAPPDSFTSALFM